MTTLEIFIAAWVLLALGTLFIMARSRRRNPPDEGDVYSAIEGAGGEVARDA